MKGSQTPAICLVSALQLCTFYHVTFLPLESGLIRAHHQVHERPGPVGEDLSHQFGETVRRLIGRKSPTAKEALEQTGERFSFPGWSAITYPSTMIEGMKLFVRSISKDVKQLSVPIHSYSHCHVSPPSEPCPAAATSGGRTSDVRWE